MLLIALLAATVAAGEPPAPSQTNAAPAAVKPTEADPKICRKEEGTGTLIAKRVCLRKSEWDRQARAARDMGARVQQNGTLGPPPL